MENIANDLIFEANESSYRFTCLKFNMDGVEYDARQVMESNNFDVLAKLVAIKSGIIEKCDETE